MPIEPTTGLTKEEVVQYLLDEVARRAVGRSEANPDTLVAAYRQAYTPLGGVSVELGAPPAKAESIIFDQRWCRAVDALYGWVEDNTQFICDSFRNDQKPWPWDI